MSTNKLRIQAYVEGNLYQQFEQERSQWGISQSQALERMLVERYQSDIAKDKEIASDRDLTPLVAAINELRLKVSALEDELESKLLSKLESKLLNNLPLVTTELPSESITSLPSESISESDSNLFGESSSKLNDNLPSESVSELDSNLSGELPSESITSLPSESVSESDSNLSGESTKLVVCKLYKNAAKDPQSWRYWAGAKAGFVEDLSKAKTYTEKGSSKVINQLLEDEIHKPTSRERISCRALEELRVFYEKYPVIC